VQHLDFGGIQLDLTKSLSATSTTGGSGSAATDTSGSDSGDSSGGATDDIPFTPYQRMIVAHAVFCVFGFALLLPCGVLLARYLRTFNPTWYTGHWIAQFGLGMTILRRAYTRLISVFPAGPAILIGVVLGFKASGDIGYKILDDHKASHPICIKYFTF
jgi:hypothetical protein